ncbi:MAG: hypothetical protein XD98_0015 [Microgenomates bacterium 39_6]|nr:MAG: hypothetical protein XD98_0015 [Microgenomates bacterium 39_6]
MTESLNSNINLNNKPHIINENKPENITQEHQEDKLAPKEKSRKLVKLGKVKRFVYAALVGISLTACQNNLSAQELREMETLGDTSPMVATAYQTYLNNKTQNNQENTIESTRGLNEPEAFEVPAVDQTIRPGSRVQVVETGGYGLNIRSEAGTNSNLVTNAADGTVFKVIELAGEKDGYHWVLVKSEAQEGQNEIVGYAVTNWFQVLRNEPVQ